MRAPIRVQGQGRHYAEQPGVPFVFLSYGEEVRFLDPDLRAWLADEELVDRAFLSQDPGLNAGDRKGALDTLADATQRRLDARKRPCPVCYRQIGEVDVDRQPGKVSDEQVDCRPALQREASLLRDVRQGADQQLDLPPVSLIHRHRDPPEP